MTNGDKHSDGAGRQKTSPHFHRQWVRPPELGSSSPPPSSHPRHLLHRHRSHNERRSPGTTRAREKWTPPGPRSTRSVCTPSGALAATDTCCCSRPIQQTTRAAASTDGLQADFVSPDMQDKYNSDMQDKYKYKYKVQIQDKNTKIAFCSIKLHLRGTWTIKH